MRLWLYSVVLVMYSALKLDPKLHQCRDGKLSALLVRVAFVHHYDTARAALVGAILVAHLNGTKAYVRAIVRARAPRLQGPAGATASRRRRIPWHSSTAGFVAQLPARDTAAPISRPPSPYSFDCTPPIPLCTLPTSQSLIRADSCILQRGPVPTVQRIKVARVVTSWASKKPSSPRRS